MMPSDPALVLSSLGQALPLLLPLLLRAALFSSLAILLVLTLRRPARRWLGAGVAYQAWIVVPLVACIAVLPARATPTVYATALLVPVQTLTMQAMPAPTRQINVLLALWAIGALALAWRFVAMQRAFLRRAGPLTHTAGLWTSRADVGPASVGLWRPIIVVPRDFAQRYTAQEQALIIAHEQVHSARRDAWANLAAALFQCMFWCNPLVHLAAHCMRADQELACDARVMQRHPRQRRSYGQALLKCAAPGAPPHATIDCHWTRHHPTKERLMHLQQTPPGAMRRRAGRLIVAIFAAGAAFGTLGARAEPHAAAPSYAVAMTLDAGGAQSAPRVLARSGETFAVASGAWRIEMTLTPAAPATLPGSVWLAGTLYKDGAVVSAPRLLARMNEPATIKVGEGAQPFTLSMVVSPQP